MDAVEKQPGAAILARDLVESPDLLLHGVNFNARECMFLDVLPRAYRKSSFLDNRIKGSRECLHGVGFDELARLIPRFPPPSPAPVFLAHTSFCCSTLLSRLLDFERHTLVLREPQVLIMLARAFRDHPARFPPRDAKAYLALVLRLLNKRYHAGQRVVIKPSPLANRLLAPWLDIHPDSRGVVLTCGLTDFLVSVLRKRAETLEKMPWVAESLVRDSDYRDRLPGLGQLPRDPLRAAAIVWHAQRYMLGKLVECHGDRFRVLDVRTFLAQPQETLQWLCSHLSLDVSGAALRRRARGPVMSRHAKQPDSEYDAVARAADQDRTAKRHARRIRATASWMEDLLRRLPDPLPMFADGGSHFPAIFTRSHLDQDTMRGMS